MFVCLCSFVVSGQTVTICPEGTVTTPNEVWWPVPGFIPASDGWVFVEWDLRTDFAIPEDIVPHMQRLIAALKSRGVTVVGIPIPTRGMLHAQYLDKTNPIAAAYSPETATQNYLAAIEQYESLGMVMVNPLSYLTENVDTLNFKTDMHWTNLGGRQVAQAVADTLNTLPEVAEMTKYTYTLEDLGAPEYQGIYNSELVKLCNTPLAKEPNERFAISGGPEVGLLDEASPEVMLVGTSFSGEEQGFDFDKFLKAASGLDIATLYTDGGTKWYSLERLLVSEPAELPKVLLWEFPAINIESWEVQNLRRIIPMVYGPCTVETTLRSEDHTLSEGGLLITNPDDLPITGSGHFLQLEFPDVTVRDFLLNFVYKDGSSEQLRISRDNRVENAGRFQIELSDALTGILDKVELQNTEYQGSVKASLCQTK
jgi:alginate biosynthesis protein AlgX